MNATTSAGGLPLFGNANFSASSLAALFSGGDAGSTVATKLELDDSSTFALTDWVLLLIVCDGVVVSVVAVGMIPIDCGSLVLFLLPPPPIDENLKSC